MRHLLNLQVHNYKSLENCDMNFNDRGLVCVLGSTDDPLSPSNGAGKSTIRSALTWCWFGKNNAGQKADNILSWFEPKDCCVKTILCDGFDTNNKPINKIEITRHRNHYEHANQIHISLDGKTSHYADNDEAQKLIESLLGFNYDIFSILLTTGLNNRKIVDFVQMTDSERKDFMDYLLDLTYINRAQEFVKEDIKQVYAEIQTIDNKLSTLQELTKVSLEKMENYKKQKEQFLLQKTFKLDNIAKEIDQIKASKIKIMGDIDAIKQRVADVIIPELPKQNKEIDELRQQRTEILQEIKKIEEKIQSHKMDIREHEISIKDFNNDVYVFQDTEEMLKLDSAVKEIANNIKIKNAERRAYERDKDIHVQLKDAQHRKIEEIEELIARKSEARYTQWNDSMRLSYKIEKLEKNTEPVCMECGQSLTLGYKNECLNKYKKALAEVNNDIAFSDKFIAEYRTKQDMLVKKMIAENEELYETAMNNFEKETAKLSCAHKKAQEDYTNLYNQEVLKQNADYKKKKEKQIKLNEKEIQSLSAKIETLNSVIKGYNADIEKVNIKLNALDDKYKQTVAAREEAVAKKNALINENNSLVKQYESADSMIQIKLKDAQNIREENNPYIALIDDISRDIYNHTETSKKYNYTKNALLRKVRYMAYWEKGFSNAGIKSFILDSIINLLNTKANYCLDRLTNGEIRVIFDTQKELKSSKEKRENFNLKIIKMNNDATYEDLSKGERVKTTFACNYALQFIAEYYHNTKLNFMFYDESLDGLDDAGCPQMIRFLREEVSRFGSIFVVTHNSQLRNMFDNMLIVTKSHGKTNIKF